MIVAIQVAEGFLIGTVIALSVCDGQVEKEAGAGGEEFSVALRDLGMGESGFHVLKAGMDELADEMQGVIADEGAGEEAGFAEDLEAVANAEDEFAAGGLGGDAAHDGGEAGDGAAAEVVAVREATGKDNEIELFNRGFLVPDVFCFQAEIALKNVIAVLVAIGAWEPDDSGFH